MPHKPKRACQHSGCPRLTDGLYCAEHQALANKQYNKYQRDPASNKRYGHAWKRIRNRYIKAHPLCEECLKNSIIKPAEEVHHINPLAHGGNNDTQNLMSLCKSCHSRITLEANKNSRAF
ncbi:MAG: HNH endonuclease signature motif containing protein [Ruthenibacterium sp.]